MSEKAVTVNGHVQHKRIAKGLRGLLATREIGVLIALLLMCVSLSFATPAFLSVRNLLNIGRQVSLLGIMAVGMLFVLISREIDLSVGSTYAGFFASRWDTTSAVFMALAPFAALAFLMGVGLWLIWRRRPGLQETVQRQPSPSM